MVANLVGGWISLLTLYIKSVLFYQNSTYLDGNSSKLEIADAPSIKPVLGKQDASQLEARVDAPNECWSSCTQLFSDTPCFWNDTLLLADVPEWK